MTTVVTIMYATTKHGPFGKSNSIPIPIPNIVDIIPINTTARLGLDILSAANPGKIKLAKIKYTPAIGMQVVIARVNRT